MTVAREPPAAIEPGPAAAPVDPSPAPDASSTAPANEVRVAAPTVAPAELLGRARREVEARLGSLRVGEDGWATPAGDVELHVRLREGRCVGVRGHVPKDMDCADVATWLGYGPGAYPLRRADSCEWPGISLKHRLAAGVAGRYVPATREFEILLRE